MSLTYQTAPPGAIVSVTMHGLHARGTVVVNELIEGAWVLTIENTEGFLVSVDWAKNPEVHLVAESEDHVHALEPTG